MTHSLGSCRVTARIGALLLVALIAFTTSTAFAHARLVKSDPKDKAELSESPKQVELWFNELLDVGFNHVTVFPAAELKQKKRTNFVEGALELDQTDRTHLTVKLKSLAPGDYFIEYRVLSRDGHTAPGRIKFTVKSPR